MIDWQWNGWAARNSAVSVYGDGDSMKSFILLALSVSIATETALFTGAPTSGGPVLFVSYGENPGPENDRRAQALLRGHKLDGTDKLWLYDGEGPLLSPTGFTRLRRELDKRRARVLIIDSLTSNAGLPPAQSNDPDAVRALLSQTVLTLTRDGVTVYGIAHTAKYQAAATAKPRGTAEWYNAVDSGVFVKARLMNGQRRAILKNEKGRIGGRDPRSLWIEFHDLNPDKTAIQVRSGYYAPETVTAQVIPKTLRPVVTFIGKQDGPVPSRRIEAYFKSTSRPTLYRHLKHAVDLKLITRPAEGLYVAA
jgi:hypothetical protein